MALGTFSSQGGRRELDVRKYEREKDEETDSDYLQPGSRCPACSQECDVTLILPCSHTMCGHCLASGERAGSDQPVSLGANGPVCSVLCPCCRYPVELPCWTWSSAASCLPSYPRRTPACVSRKHGDEGGTTHSFLRGLGAASSSETPADGVEDLQEKEMEQSVFGKSFALDSSNLPPTLHLSNTCLTVTCQGEKSLGSTPDNKVKRWTVPPEIPSPLPLVCADVVIARGQYYWEVDVCNSSMYRIGVISLDRCAGWWLERSGLSFCAVYDGSSEPLCAIPPQIKTIGVFLNIGGGTLSFHNPLTQEHLATLPTRFSHGGVVPALGLGHGRLRLRCGLPPPPHVFLSKDSAYRRPGGTGGSWWCKEISFQSVRKVIQKFEQLAVSDSDSGLVSSSGSSCSTLASLADLGNPGTLSSVRPRQETGAE